jgi:uncharacterized protein (TIGR02145 family)
LLTAALAVVGLLGCMIVTGDPDNNGGNTTGANTHTHTWGDWVITTPATCDAQGVETRTCTQDANHKETRFISQLTGAACGNSGGGGDHVHIWGDWVVLSQATCNAQGVETRTCTQDASHKETRAIAQLTGAACNTGGGGSYESVTIGGKKWMKRNLNIETADSWCYDCDKYGRLYTWEAAKKACPSGWRLPDRADWNKLVDAAGGSSVAGKALKSRNGWNDNGNGTDSHGFSALPGGRRFSDGYFFEAGLMGYWWSATENGDIFAYALYMYSLDSLDDSVYDGNFYKNYGLSVRCVAD